jgi:hypothetical protein
MAASIEEGEGKAGGSIHSLKNKWFVLNDERNKRI